MLSQDIRRRFLQYFRTKGHTIVPSSPVVPHDDPTLLFTNAGMNQFKDVFLGESKRDYARATTSQKCVRVGGKHNDLENVGHTKRHLTFFEMLGNFSFGDYFKKEAIQFAWEVSTEIFEFPVEKLWATVYTDDDEAFDLWKAYLPENRIVRFGESENFWSMGDTGPCGPCSELHFDRGLKFGSAEHIYDDEKGDRFMEFWNLVFMQYNRQADGQSTLLPKPSVDTGMGLERLIALKMGVDSVFETDVLRGLIAQVEELSGQRYESSNEHAAAPFRVLADHLRCLAFAITDGVQPSNVDRGYVLRKVLRRAVRYGRSLGLDKPFLAKLLPELNRSMGEDYPDLIASQSRIEEILTLEEEAFLRTLRRGGNLLSGVIEKAQNQQSKQISGEEAFKLKDTYGLPIDEILLIAKDAELTVDEKRFEELEVEAKERSRKVHKSTKQIASTNIFESIAKEHGETLFTGYKTYEGKGKVLALVVDQEFTDEIVSGQEAMLILDQTPFYAEMGGQVGDRGTIADQFKVQDCQSPFKGIIAHIGTLKEGTLKVGDEVNAVVNASRRDKIARNHTATHLLHWALQKVLGEHIKQAGSVVDDKRLRFDFSHHKALTVDEVRQIEDLINEKIRQNQAVSSYELSYEEAQADSTIKQFFGDKYGNTVRVIDIDYSKELCGGTHTDIVGNIGYFRIAKESSISAGIRRIEAVSGKEAEEFAREPEQMLEDLAQALKTQPKKLSASVERLLKENKELSKTIKDLQKGALKRMLDQLLGKKEIVNNKNLLAAQIDVDSGQLADVAEDAMKELESGIVVLATQANSRCNLVVRVSDDLVGQGVNAKEIIQSIAPIVGGGGGGRANSAQAGGKTPEKIAEALAKTRELIESK